MAIKPAAATTAETPAPEVEADANVLDTQSASVKRLIAKGKERGYITFDELNAVLPAEQNSSEQIEDIMAMLSEMGIQVVESEEGEDPEAATAKEEAADDEDLPPAISPNPPSAAPMTRCACICAKWARWNCSPARAKSRSPSGSKPGGT